MACIAIVTVWAFECPHCPHFRRHWHQVDAARSAASHIQTDHYGTDLDGSHWPERILWAFNVHPDSEEWPVHRSLETSLEK